MQTGRLPGYGLQAREEVDGKQLTWSRSRRWRLHICALKLRATLCEEVAKGVTMQVIVTHRYVPRVQGRSRESELGCWLEL